jgi:hypothetical protein
MIIGILRVMNCWNTGMMEESKIRIQNTVDPSGVEPQNHSTGQAGDGIEEWKNGIMEEEEQRERDFDMA